MEEYYELYWKERLNIKDVNLLPIRSSIPRFLVRYTQYGSCLNLLSERVRMLDIGCGEGNVSELYINKKNNIVFGLEVSETAAVLSVKKGVKVIRWDINDIPFPFKDKGFEAVTMTDVLEHVINPISLLQEAKRILKPDGKLVVLVPNFAYFRNRVRMLLTCVPRDKLHWEGYGDGMEHLHWFTKPKLKEFLLQTGFLNIKFYPIGLPFGFIFGLLGCHNMAELLLVDAKP